MITYFPLSGKAPTTFKRTPREKRRQRQKNGINQNNKRLDINPNNNKKKPSPKKTIVAQKYKQTLYI